MSTKTNILVEQGATFNKSIIVHDPRGIPISFSANSTGVAQMKRNYFSLSNTTFTVALSNTTGITLGMDANTTGTLWPGRYIYDVLVTDPSGTKTRIIEGQIEVTPACTNQPLTIN